MLFPSLHQLLTEYRPADEAEKQSQMQMLNLVGNPRCLLRENLAEHFTASAFIIAPNSDRTLLTHHRKIGRWLQLGGHADGDEDLAAVAMKESFEESCLTKLRLLSPRPFDLDVHEISAHKTVPTHLHHDVVFLIEADPEEALVVSEESLDLAWSDFDDPRVTGHSRLTRMAAKVRRLRQNLD